MTHRLGVGFHVAGVPVCPHILADLVPSSATPKDQFTLRAVVNEGTVIWSDVLSNSAYREARQPRMTICLRLTQTSNVESKMNYVAFLHDVVFPF